MAPLFHLLSRFRLSTLVKQPWKSLVLQEAEMRIHEVGGSLSSQQVWVTDLQKFALLQMKSKFKEDSFIYSQGPCSMPQSVNLQTPA